MFKLGDKGRVSIRYVHLLVNNSIHLFNEVNINFIACMFQVCFPPRNAGCCCTRKSVADIGTASSHNTQHFANNIWRSYHLPQYIRFRCKRKTIVYHLIQKLQVTVHTLMAPSILQKELFQIYRNKELKYKIHAGINMCLHCLYGFPPRRKKKTTFQRTESIF